MDFFIINFKLEKKSHYAIYYTNSEDGVMVDNNQITHFISKQKLLAHCKESGICCSSNSDDLYKCDLDVLGKWLRKGRKRVDCQFVLNAWNTMSDVARSLGKSFIGDDDDVDAIHFVYKKLFYGNNLPALKMKRKYTPSWNSDEIDTMSFILSNGLQIIREGLSHPSKHRAGLKPIPTYVTTSQRRFGYRNKLA